MSVKSYIESNKDRFVEELFSLIRIPSISAKQEHQSDMWACAQRWAELLCASRPGAKQAILHYRLIASSDRYYLLEIDLKTGRHHQIRCQLAHMGCPIKGDLKYGFERSNRDGGISLHARSAAFIHPVSKQSLVIEAPVPDDPLWRALAEAVE